MATRIPINKDSFGFEDRQDDIWKKMEEDMERRRKEWENEIEKMSTDFFAMRPERSTQKFDTLSDRIGIAESYDDGKSVIEKNEQGQPVFKARFNVKDYKPEEVNVKMDANKIIVQAKHEENSGGSSVSREYSREVNIPKEIDPMALQCTISNDGVLCVEAPLPLQDCGDPIGPSPKAAMTQQSNSVGSPFHSGKSSPASFQQQQQQQQQQHLQQQRVSTPPYKPQPPQFTPAFEHNQQFQPPQRVDPYQQSPPEARFVQTQSSQPRQFQPPAYQGQGYSTPPPSFTSSANPTVTHRTASPVTSAEKNFKIDTDIEDFSPEDLTVKTVDKKIMITARREEKNGNRTSTREMSREFTIPDNVDPYTIKAFFTDGGKLVLEAPYLQQTSGPYTNGGPLNMGSAMTGR